MANDNAIPPPSSSSSSSSSHVSRTLESQNATLYEDNRKLVTAVNMLNDRLAFLGAPQNMQALRFAEMQERLRVSESNWASINQQYQELLHSLSAGSAQHHIAMDLCVIRDAYMSLDREYRALKEKYLRLKSGPDTIGHIAQPHPHGTARAYIQPHPRVHSRDRNHVNPPSPTAVISSQPADHRRRSSEGVPPQAPLRHAPAHAETTSPTGPQMSPRGFPVHLSVPAASLPLPHHAPSIHGSCNASVALEQSAPEQFKSPGHHQRSAEHTDTGDPPSASSVSATRPQKRPSADMQICKSPEGDYKKLRIKEAPDSPADNAPPLDDNDLSPSESGSALRSDRDCVSLIFEKDADVEDGIFCGLCLDRYEAKMIQEPPDVLIHPDFDSLVTHCKSMHPTAWEDLRRKLL